MTARRTMTIDSQGTVRSGPRGAWWIWMQRRPLSEIPSGRQVAYNVIGVAYLVGGGVLAHRLGELVQYLSGLALLSALGAGLIALVTLHLSRQEARRQLPDRSQTAPQTALRTATRLSASPLRTGE
jgi:hypothetical protein